MPAFTAVGAYVAGTLLGLAGTAATIVGAIVATGAAYITSRVINGNPNKGNNSARNEGGRIQVPPATNNKIPVVYGSAYVNGIITDARLISLEQKKNDKMFYCIVLSEYTNNLTTPTYGIESVYWNDLRLTPLDASGNAHIVKDGRKVVDGAIVTAGSFVVGNTYVITKIGTTTQAQWNTIAGTVGQIYAIGSIFTCANAGTGTGQAQEEDFIDKNFIIDTEQYVELRVYAGGSSAADQIYPPQSTGNTANAYNFWGSGGTLYPDGDGSWTTGNEMNGLVFAIVSVRYNGEKGFTGLPNMTFQLANNVSNPADVWKDYMTSQRYGAGIPAAELDDTARTAWYNFCEEDITYTNVAGEINQATTRYAINGVIDTSNPVKTNIDSIMQNGGAWLSYDVATGLWSPVIKKAVSAGELGLPATYFTASRTSNILTVTNFPTGRIEAGQLLYNSAGTLIGTIVSQTTPTAGETAGQIGTYTTSAGPDIGSTTFYTLPASNLEFDDDNIISGISLSSTRLDDLYNSVEVEFYNKYNKDQKAYYRTSLDNADRNPNEPDNQLRMSLDLCNNSMQSDLIGQLELRQSRDDLVIEFTTNQYGIQAQAGDIIAVTSELYDWAPKYFRVMRVKEQETDEGGLVANIQALEYNPDVYTIEPITEFSTSANIGIGVYGSSPNLPAPPDVIIAAVDADVAIPNFQLQVTIPTTGGPYDEIELYYTEGWDEHPITGSIVPGTGSNGAAVGQGLLTVTATTYGNINAGDRIDLLAPAQDIYIVSQLTNTPASKTFVSGGVPASTTSTLLTLNNVTGLIVGNTLTGTGIPNGSFIIEIDAGTNTVRIEDAVTAQAAGTYTVSGGLGTYVVDTSTTISGTTDLYDFPEADNYKLLKKIVPEGNNPTFTNGEIVTDVITTVPANSATYRRWFVKARMGIKKRFGAFSSPGDTDFDQGRFPYNPNPSGGGGGGLPGVFSSVDINNTTPWLTFSTQPDGVNPKHGIRGRSTEDDYWFVGGASAGDDLGYLELATADNAGGSNSGGEIYVRQYNGAGAGGPEWVTGGTGTAQRTLTLLDNLGNTQIPQTLTINNGTVLTNSGNVFLFNTNATQVDAFAAATQVNFGINGDGQVDILPTRESTSPSTGALQVSGGVGIAKKLHMGGTISVDDTLNATSTTSGSIQTDGGVAVAQDIFVGGNGIITVDLAVNGGDITTTQTTASLFDTTTTTLNIGRASTATRIGATTGTTTIGYNLNLLGPTLTLNSDDTVFDFDPNIVFADDGVNPAVIVWDSGDQQFSFSKPIFTVTDKDITSSGNFVLDRSVAGVYASDNATIRVDRAGGLTDATITWNEGTDKWDISNSVTVASDLAAGSVTTNTINSTTATAITLSGPDVTIAGDLAINGAVNADITTTASIVNLFLNNALFVTAFSDATQINIGNSATANNFNGFIALNNITSRFADTTTTTATTQFTLTSTTRNSMKAVINMKKGTDVHICEILVVAVDATTALLTVYGEMFNTAKLADFDADVSSGTLRLRVTPTSATSTVFNFIRDSLA